MTLLFLDALSKKTPNVKFFIATSRNKKLLQDISSEYPHIEVIDYPKGIFKFLFSKNIVITPPTPATLPWHQKLGGWIISRMPQSKLYGFDDSAKINKFLYSDLVPFRVDILYIDLLFSLCSNLGLQISREGLDLNIKSLDIQTKKLYIVFHPFGASEGRSFLGEKLKQVTRLIQENFPNHTLYITGSPADSHKVSMLGQTFQNFIGKNINEVANLIEQADLFIGVDTGITHLANVLGKKTLVLAEQGTPHWLPYYNPQATIVCQIKNDTGPNDGQVYLESKRMGRIRYLDRIPLSIIESYIKKISHEISKK